MRLAAWFRPSGPTSTARQLYCSLVDQARAPGFYRDHGVPDSLDGRYEMIALHVFLALHRLKRVGEAGSALAQALFDTMFADMDRSLREIGVSDLGVGRRIKDMAKGLYGRISAYETGLNGPDPALEDALRRNLFGTVPAVTPEALGFFVRYARQAVEAYGVLGTAAVLAGETPVWPPLPGDGSASDPDVGGERR